MFDGKKKMNLTRRSLFASALAPVVASADSLTNLFKTTYALVDHVSETSTYSPCLNTVNLDKLSEFNREMLTEKYYYRGYLHRDHPTLDCLVSPVGNPTKYSNARLIHKNGYDVFWYYSAKLDSIKHKDPYGIYGVYLPVDICNKYKLTMYNNSYITHLS